MEKGHIPQKQYSASMTELHPASSSALEACEMNYNEPNDMPRLAAVTPSPAAPISAGSGLNATRDARAIVRLFQCSICSRPYDKPAALPCGNSICFSCLPKFHERQNISYPNTPDRQHGFVCPFDDCQREHAMGDFSVDFTLQKSLEIMNTELNRFQPFEESTSVMVEEVLDLCAEGASKREPQTAVVRGGCLAASYSLAASGQLPIHADLEYSSVSGEDLSYLDEAVLQHLKEKLRSELQCFICYSIFLNPVTTSCGHTFCRGCLERVLDHSQLCPICRKLQMITTTFLQFMPSNQRITDLLVGLFPDDLARRAILGEIEDGAGGPDGELSTALFVCTLSFPAMPTFLHIFEPRYRLMVRRAWQGNKRFGMVLPNRTGAVQGELGNCPFQQFGTLLEIKTYQLLPDGRSWIETVGVSRFRVKKWGWKDAYIVAETETVEDLPIAEEEALEALETSPNARFAGAQPPLWTLQSTQQLFQIAKNFVHKMQQQSAPWLHQQGISVYGNPPDDPAIFPYWLASVLPIAEDERYRLLSCNSVRGRLKIIVAWVKRISDQQWFSSSSSCVVI